MQTPTFWIFSLSFLISAKAAALGINDCAGLPRELCMWKLTCAKDPDQPNKIIPADCAQNWKDPEPPKPAPVAPKAEPPKPKTPIQQLYYFDLSELEDQKLLPDDASGEEVDEETERQLAGQPVRRNKTEKDKEKPKPEQKGLTIKKGDESDADAQRLQNLIKRGEGWEEVQ